MSNEGDFPGRPDNIGTGLPYSERVDEPTSSLPDQFSEAIQHGDLLNQFRALKPLDRARFASRMYTFLYDMEMSQTGVGLNDTDGEGIWEKYPEVFLGSFRKGKHLDLETARGLTDWGAHAALRVHLDSLLSSYSDQIQRFGNQAVAHLLLSHQTFVKLEHAGIATIPALEHLISTRWVGARLSNKRKGEIKRKLAEWKELPDDQKTQK